MTGSSGYLLQCGKLERRQLCSYFSLILSIIYLIELCGAESLYKPEDGLLELNVTTFDKSIYNQPKGFFVEFYSSWCGHCIDYAPHYVKIAKLLKPWKNVMVVAALNCADEVNAPVCREHSIDAFPTLKYFKVQSKDAKDSIRFTGDKKNEQDVSLFIANLLYNDYNAFHPSNWPNYEFTPNSKRSMSDLWSSASAQVSLLCMVVESNTTVNGFALMTNYVEDERVNVVVLSSSHPVAAHFGGVQIPAIHIFSRRNPDQVVFSSNTEMTWMDMKTHVDSFLLLEPSPTGQIQQPISDDKEKSEHAVIQSPAETGATWGQYEVQLMDLQKTMLYMLSVEVPRNPQLRGNELAALRGWIHLLRKYAPGTAPMRRLFYRLDEWLQRSNLAMEIGADEWLKVLEKIQGELGHPLPSHSNYMACRGSEKKYRGYTCGLWTLFHAITVRAYQEEKSNAHFKPYDDVLEPIHQFVVQFLSCEMCAKHFDKMTREREMRAAQHPEDVVLWLWRAHNAVNRRLSGDATDDPKFPKRQFPPVTVCSACHTGTSESIFNEAATLDFLVSYYSDVKTDGIVLQPEYEMKQFENGRLKDVQNGRLNPKFVGMAGKLDKIERDEALNSKTQNTGPKREWKSITDNVVEGSRSTDRSTFYLIWLVIIGLALGFSFIKYRQNRSKFWKTFYYYSDYKLFPWRRNSDGLSRSSSFRKFTA